MGLRLLLVAACVLALGGCHRSARKPSWQTERPENAHPYSDATLADFQSLIEADAWRFPDWDASGLLSTVHEQTGLEFVLIPGGHFEMGSEEDRENTLPVHRVTIRPFLLSKTECTKLAWSRGLGQDEHAVLGRDLPVRHVDWEDARVWCDRVDLRLPSEAEWEYACRAGSTSYWSFGEDSDLLRHFAWYDENSRGVTHPVAEKKPNAWGLFDVHGNVSEWCEDRWHENYEGAPADGSAWTSGDRERVQRGGGTSSCLGGTASAFRKGPNSGFRPARGLGLASGAPAHVPEVPEPESEWKRQVRLAGECRLDWIGPLREACKQANKFVLRDTGGDSLDQPPLYETSDPDEVAGLLARIEIDREASRRVGSCLCSGEFELWFIRDVEGEDYHCELMSLHHGIGLRWSEWPGDGCLTVESSRAIGEWLHNRGFPKPLEEAREHNQALLAARKKRAATIAALPPNLRTVIGPEDDDEEIIAAFAERIPDPVERAAAAFRVLGCMETVEPLRSWSAMDTPLLRHVLPSLSDSDIEAAIRQRAGADPAVRRGAMRWTSCRGKNRAVLARDPEDALRILGRIATPR